MDGGRGPGNVGSSIWSTVQRNEIGVTSSSRLVAVRRGQHGGFARWVFEFDGARAPGYRVGLNAQPSKCGSGEMLPGTGGTWLEMRFAPAVAHALSEAPVGPTLPPTLTSTCDFEGEVGFALPLPAETPFRILRLTSPTRIVIDIQAKGHPS